MASATLGLLVSGHGEVEALPVLVRRILHERLNIYDVQCGQEGEGTLIRKPEGQLLKRDGVTLEKTARRILRRANGLLVLVDLEDDCPAEEGPRLQATLDDLEAEAYVVCAYREIETWFLFDAQGLLGAQAPEEPERRRDAKKWLKELGAPRYNEMADSPRYCGTLDLERVAAHSDSFRVLCDRIERLAQALSPTGSPP